MSCSKERKHIDGISERREIAHALVKRNNELALWDSIQARDVDPQILEFVIEQFELGTEPRGIRRILGINASTDKSWKKILAGVRQGIRVDSTGMFLRLHTQNELIGGKMQKLIEHELTSMQERAEGKDSELPPYRGFSKEITMAVDALNRLRQGTVKLGKELGVFEQPGEKGQGGGGVTIVIKNHIPFPSAQEITAHQEKNAAKNKELLEQAKAIPSTARPVENEISKPQT